MSFIEFKAEEVQYLVSLISTRYSQLKKTEQSTSDDEILKSLKSELPVLISLYNKLEPVYRSKDD